MAKKLIGAQLIIFSFLFAVFFAFPALATQATPAAEQTEARIERIEPAFWWVGMKSNQLQLMVHGNNIADFMPVLAYPGVHIQSLQRVSNRNYLFINLSIAHHAKAGKFDIHFKPANLQKLQNPQPAQKPPLKYTYELREREKNSASRIGFNASDVILNLMPDRFSNGDPANDNLPGFLEKTNRADIDAGRHGGDIQGITQHLDYFASMGYTMLWPTPLTESNQPKYSYHGYAATETYKIDARFGSNEDYRRMVAAAKRVGIGVIQDVVLNHIGSNHWWMRDLPMKDWLSFEGEFIPTYHARTTANDPYASVIDRKNFTAGWFELDMPDMNQRNALLATYQIQNTIWWIEYAGLAGVRADTYGYSDPAFLTAWSGRVMAEYPHLNIVGEEWSLNPVTVSYWQRGKKNANGYVSYLPSVMDFPLNDNLRKSLVAEDSMHSGLNDLYEGLTSDTLYPDPMNLVLFEGNHDVSRIFSALNEDFDLYKMAMAYVLTMRGIPQIYYGTEILMTSPKTRDDGKFRQDFPGGWAGDKVNAVTGIGLSSQQKEAQIFLKRLINWRKSQAAIHHGKLLHFAPDQGTYVYFRYDTKHKIMVVLNKNKSAKTLATNRFQEILPRQASAIDVITGKSFDLSTALTIPPRSVLVLDVTDGVDVK